MIQALRTHRTLAGGLLAAILVGLAAAGWVLSAPRPVRLDAAWLEQPGDAGRGERLFEAGDCASCHATPGQDDPRRLGGGLALGSPFGTLYPPNISSDPADGIGRWRTIDLTNALLAGVSPKGQHYYPGFPYTSFTRLTPGDVRDLMAYLRSLPPVRGRTPPHDLPFPFTIRRLLGFWKLLFFDPGPLPADDTHDALWQRGRYLVEGPGHCAECHSARNLAGAIKPASRLAGGKDQEGVGLIPNITPAGIGRWSDAELERCLETGVTPDFRPLASSMASVIGNLARLPPGDRQAIAAYLRSLPPRHSPDAVRQR